MCHWLYLPCHQSLSSLKKEEEVSGCVTRLRLGREVVCVTEIFFPSFQGGIRKLGLKGRTVSWGLVSSSFKLI